MIPILAMQAPDFPQRVKQQALAITFDVIDRRAFIYIRGHGFAQIDMPSDPTFAVFIEALLQGGNHA